MGDQSIVELCLDKTHTKKSTYDCFIFYVNCKLHIACVDSGSSCMGLPARDTITAHSQSLPSYQYRLRKQSASTSGVSCV